jgi:small Trp-rich protein
MYFLGLGLVLLVMKYLETDPVASWSWWIVMAPFGLAVAWWAWADSTGYTKKKAMEREDARRDARVAKNRDALGLPPKQNKRR